MPRLLLVARNPSLAFGLASASDDIIEVRPALVGRLAISPGMADVVVIEQEKPADALATLDLIRAGGLLAPALLVASTRAEWAAFDPGARPSVAVLDPPITQDRLSQSVGSTNGLPDAPEPAAEPTPEPEVTSTDGDPWLDDEATPIALAAAAAPSALDDALPDGPEQLEADGDPYATATHEDTETVEQAAVEAQVEADAQAAAEAAAQAQAEAEAAAQAEAEAEAAALAAEAEAQAQAQAQAQAEAAAQAQAETEAAAQAEAQAQAEAEAAAQAEAEAEAAALAAEAEAQAQAQAQAQAEAEAEAQAQAEAAAQAEAEAEAAALAAEAEAQAQAQAQAEAAAQAQAETEAAAQAEAEAQAESEAEGERDVDSGILAIPTAAPLRQPEEIRFGNATEALPAVVLYDEEAELTVADGTPSPSAIVTDPTHPVVAWQGPVGKDGRVYAEMASLMVASGEVLADEDPADSSNADDFDAPVDDSLHVDLSKVFKDTGAPADEVVHDLPEGDADPAGAPAEPNAPADRPPVTVVDLREPLPEDPRSTPALVRALLSRSHEVYGVTEAGNLVVGDALARTGASAGALLLQDGDTWRVAAGEGLRRLEHRYVLSADSWLVTTIASRHKGVIIDRTDVARRPLAGAPLAAHKHLVAAPVRAVAGILLIARDDDPAFGERDLASLARLAEASAGILASAMDARQLARLLGDIRDQDDRTAADRIDYGV